MLEEGRIIEERRYRFIKKYKEEFGVALEIKPPISDEEKMESGEYVLTINFYGVKSSWM